MISRSASANTRVKGSFKHIQPTKIQENEYCECEHKHEHEHEREREHSMKIENESTEL